MLIGSAAGAAFGVLVVVALAGRVFGSPGEEPTTVLAVDRGRVAILDKDGMREEAVVGAPARVAMVGDSLGAVAPVIEPQPVTPFSPAPQPAPGGSAGFAQVRSAPAGGICTVDGVLQGITPLTVRIPAGVRRITVAWDRGQVWALDTTIMAGDTVRVFAQIRSLPEPAATFTPATPRDTVVSDSSAGATVGADGGKIADTAAAVPQPARAAAPVKAVSRTVRRVGTRSLVTGAGRRISGYVQPAILRLPGVGNVNPWSGDQSADIARYATDNSDLDVDPYWPAVSFDGVHHRFDSWQRSALRRGGSMRRELSALTPEEDALELLAEALGQLGDRNVEECRARLTSLCGSFLSQRFGMPVNPDAPWAAPLKKAGVLAAWEEEYLRAAEESYRTVLSGPKPRGRDVAGLYTWFRICHMMRFPILFCAAAGVAEALSDEHARLLRTYLDHGGALYLTAGIDECWAMRGVIKSILGESLRDSLGQPLLRALQNGDRYLSGFDFPGPRPAIFHPWTCLPMTVSTKVNVEVTMLNNRGVTVFTDTIRSLGKETYDQRTTCYRWNGIDKKGNEVSSGYYLCRVECGLYRQTWPLRVSALRLLPAGRHPVFHAFFDVSDVPFAGQRPVEEMNLPYDEPGTFGVSKGSRLVICYSEAHNEFQLLTSAEAKGFGREPALKWLTNVIVNALGEGSLARGGN